MKLSEVVIVLQYIKSKQCRNGCLVGVSEITMYHVNIGRTNSRPNIIHNYLDGLF